MEKVADHPPVAEGHRCADGGTGRSRWLLPAVLGAGGSLLLALATDLPRSPYGPHAAGLWPLEASGPAPGWEGPTVPSFAQLADQGQGVPTAHLLVTLAVVAGVVLMALAWALVWRRRRDLSALGVSVVGVRELWWMVGAWVAPLLLAAPLGSQDVWTYGAEGNLVRHGISGYRYVPLLKSSVWSLGVDAKALRASPYGPGALDLSALFARISGGRPWVAAECWRLAAILGLILCGWGVHRIVGLRGGNTTAAVLLGVANPAMLIILVGGIHNDALMLGLIVAGVALAVSGAPWWGMALCALGVSVKPNALFAVGAVAWWAWGRPWRARATAILAAVVIVVAVLLVAGLGSGGGFGWLTALFSNKAIQGTFSLGYRFFGTTPGSAAAIEVLGMLLAVACVLTMGRTRGWVVSLGWAYAVLAVTIARPEPWYLAWAVVLLACGDPPRRAEQIGIAVFVAMMVGSVLPAGTLWWFSGDVVLLWLGIVWLRSRRMGPTAPPPDEGVGGDLDRPTELPVPVPAGGEVR
jgi:alpha-1,6-mannosyltransferase